MGDIRGPHYCSAEPGGLGEVYLQVNPKLGRLELEEEMIAVAEEHLAIPGTRGERKLRVRR